MKRSIASVALAFAVGSNAALAQGFGEFSGEVQARWLDGGRNMQLVKSLQYRDPQGVVWTAPAGLVTDGASIPGPLWSVVGGPFSGPHRKAAVIHDYYCEQRTRPWQQVHKAFYLASRAAGVESIRARVMYFAVYRFGPRWSRSRSGDSSEIVFKPKLVKHEFDTMRRKIERGQLDLREIQKSADRSLRSLSRSTIE